MPIPPDHAPILQIHPTINQTGIKLPPRLLGYRGVLVEKHYILSVRAACSDHRDVVATMDRNQHMIGPGQIGTHPTTSRVVRPGFSLIDLMVSIVVMGVLIGALMPAVSHVRAMAQRTECRSNIRQQGLALQMYAYDRNGKIPQSVFAKTNDREFGYAPQQTVHLRLDNSLSTTGRDDAWFRWDGLGVLYATDYITSPEVFYCPANNGLNDYPQFHEKFKNNEPGAIVGNYQYRLVDERRYLSDFPQNYTIVSNATRSPDEYSHRVGNNMLKSDMSVSWFADVGGQLLAILSATKSTGADRDQASPVEQAWRMMDVGGRSIVRGGAGGSTQPEDMHSNPNGSKAKYEEQDP